MYFGVCYLFSAYIGSQMYLCKSWNLDKEIGNKAYQCNTSVYTYYISFLESSCKMSILHIPADVNFAANNFLREQKLRIVSGLKKYIIYSCAYELMEKRLYLLSAFYCDIQMNHFLS